MKKLMTTSLIIIAIIAAIVIGYKIAYPSYTYRYRMTVEVETPQGVKSGSSVVEVHTRQMPKSLAGISGGHFSWMDIKGEGVMIKFDDKKTLFVLLGASDGSNGSKTTANLIMRYAFPLPNDPCPNSQYKDECFFGTLKSSAAMKYYGTLKNAKSILPKDRMLAMASAIETDGGIKIDLINSDDLTNVFGKGIELKQIIIETTDDSIEWKIRKSPIYSDIVKYLNSRTWDGKRIYFSNDFIIF